MQPIEVRPVRRIVANAPASICILGGLSAPFGGKVLACALPPRASATVEAPSREVLAQMRADGPLIPVRPGARPDDESLPAWAVLDELDFPAVPCTFRCNGDIPQSIALGAPAATLSCLSAAYLLRRREALLPAALAELVAHIAATHGLPGTDFAAAYGVIFGGLILIDLTGKGMGRPAGERYARVLPLAIDVAALPLVVATRAATEESSGPKAQEAPPGAGGTAPRAGAARLAALASDGYAALGDGDWPAFGAILDRHHEICSSLIETGPVQGLIAAAKAAGARGASVAGRGETSAVVALHPRPDELAAALTAAGAQQIIRPDGAEGLLYA